MTGARAGNGERGTLAQRPAMEAGEEAGMEIRTILVASGLSEESVGAVLMARRLSERLGASLHAVHVIEPVGTRVREAIPGLAERQLAIAEEEFQKFAASHDLMGHATPHVRRGNPEHEILALRKEIDADLLVIGRYGRGGLKRGRLGSIATSAARHCPVPVLVVEPTFRGEFARIAVASDLDVDAHIELRRGLWLGRALGARSITLIKAYELPMGYHTILTEEQAVAKLTEACELQAGELIASARRDDDPQVEVVCEEGSTPSAVARVCQARGIELLVLATHLRTSEGAGVLLGRTTERILNAVDCSVWAETTPELKQGWWEAIRHLFD